MLLAVLGGLLLAGGTSADWVVVEVAREVGGITVPRTSSTPGLAYAPLAVPLGVVAALLGPVLTLRRARRLVGVLLSLLGAGGLIVVVAGIVRTTGEGALAAGPGVAAAGALTVLGGGLLAVRRAEAPAAGSRYTVEAARSGQAGEDREWQLASEDEG